MTTKTTFILTFALLSLVSLAYSQSPVGAACSCSNSLEIGTLNTFEIPIAGDRPERLKAIINYFQTNNQDFDYICLQELWDPADRQSVITALQSNYPYTVQAGPRNGTCTDPCSPTDSETVLNCLYSNDCLTSDNQLSCISNQCDLDSISGSCRDCLLSVSNGITPQSKLTSCAGAREVRTDVIDSCQYLFNGQTDNLILSRYPIVNSEVHYYALSPFTVWSALYAEVQHPGLGNIQTFCTHVVANQPFVDLSQENLNETQDLISFVNAKTGNIPNRKVFIMGDFNFSPDTDNVNPLFTDSYNYMINNGFADTANVYARRSNTEYPCTSCEQNSNRGLLPQNNYAIDHIFVNQDANICVRSTNIFLNDKIVSVNDRNIEVSDHYGVRAVYCPSNTTIGNEPLQEVGNSSASSITISFVLFVGLLSQLL